MKLVESQILFFATIFTVLFSVFLFPVRIARGVLNWKVSYYG